MKSRLVPYLNFKGNAKEAMEFYKTVFGGDLTTQTYGEGGAPVTDPTEKDLIMHAELKGDEINFMAADGNVQHPVTVGDNISMSLVGSDTEKLTSWFNKLSEGGKVTYPLEKAPWGDTFGMLTDKFEINWLVNISSEQPKNA